MTPRSVTVLIPSYNYARFLPDCVLSAVGQQGVDLDVAIIDNASTDGSLELARELAAEHACIRVVSHPDNQGIVTSFNRALREIRSEYCVVLCADDALTPGSLARAVDGMQAHPTASFVYGPVYDFRGPIGDVDPAVFERRARPAILYPGGRWIDLRCEAGRTPLRAPEGLMRTSVLRRTGEYEPRCPMTFDLNMWMRLATRGDVCFLPGPPQALYRLHGQNHSVTEYGTVLADLEQHWEAFDSFVGVVEDRAAAARWEAMARDTMSRRARWAAQRALASAPAATRVEESSQLWKFGESIAGHEPSPLEEWSWRTQARCGQRWARLWPPFAVRFAYRGARRRYTNWRKERTGV